MVMRKKVKGIVKIIWLVGQQAGINKILKYLDKYSMKMTKLQL